MRRVLIVTSSYYPTMIADMHRARQLAWELPQLGWDVEVIAPGTSFQPREYNDEASKGLFNPDIAVHTVGVTQNRLLDFAGIRSVNWRSLRPMYLAGLSRLSQGKFDLVFITTAKFNLFLLGPLWKRRLGIPYVLDFHDPWVKKEARFATSGNPLKRWLSRAMARPMESTCVKSAAAVIAVSPTYIAELRERYGAAPAFRDEMAAAIPFAASMRDAQFAAREASATSPGRTTVDIVYVGAGGTIMAKSFRTICETLAAVRKAEPAVLEGVRIRLFGTYAYWKPGDGRPLQQIAEGMDLGQVVIEEPAWIPYTESLERMAAADGLLILGVDEPGYVPSKLNAYLLSGKPLLACLHAQSPACSVMQREGAGELLTLGNGGNAGSRAAAMLRFLSDAKAGRNRSRESVLSDQLAPAMAARIAELFERAVAAQPHAQGTAE